ncbi:MAG: hypothetical protein HQM16_04280 [Deltaproteobacteria bacterium]|nr:hypothetical protein [Deltaproteobacteria bacterium]
MKITEQKKHGGRFVAFCIWVIFALIITGINDPAHAWQPREREQGTNGEAEKTKVLGKMQHRHIAAKLVSLLFKDKFFHKLELPKKIALANMSLEGDDLGIEANDFTNLVLNNLLANPLVMVINQDLKTDLTLEYQLMFYLPVLETRKKGILLGADYHINGFLRTVHETKEDGKVTKSYLSQLSLRDIRTNKLVAKVIFDFKGDKAKKRKRKFRT